MSKYQIKFKNSSVETSWYSMESTHSEQMKRCKQYLQENPEDRLKSGGKLKKLKGKWQGILQYDITRRVRIHYFVDAKECIVYIEYIGPHP
jgi:mRNA-degrading endonuclease RelE of RelBE toxin-antitoxin system